MTLSEAATILGKDLHDTTGEFLTQCRQWHNDAMFLILARKKDWPFLEAQGTLATVAGQNTYSFVTDFGISNLRKVASMRDPEGRVVKLVTIEKIDRQNSASTGRPREIATWASGLILYPTPAVVETFTWRGYLRQDALASGDTPPWPDEYNPIWQLGSKAMGLQYLDDPRATQYWAMFFNQMTEMFGDDYLEDEVIEIQPFGQRISGDTFVDDSGAVWP